MSEHMRNHIVCDVCPTRDDLRKELSESRAEVARLKADVKLADAIYQDALVDVARLKEGLSELPRIIGQRDAYGAELSALRAKVETLAEAITPCLDDYSYSLDEIKAAVKAHFA